MLLPSKATEMKIGLVIHGPEVIDSGEAIKVIEKLSSMGKVEAKLGGTMGKTAVLDAGLEDLIDISQHLKPSACVECFFKTSDLVCLLNRGKTIETGKAFGKMVAARVRDPETIPFFLVESPNSTEGKLIPLNAKAVKSQEQLSTFLEKVKRINEKRKKNRGKGKRKKKLKPLEEKKKRTRRSNY